MTKYSLWKKIRKSRSENQVYFSIKSSEKEKVAFGQGGVTAAQK